MKTLLTTALCLIMASGFAQDTKKETKPDSTKIKLGKMKIIIIHDDKSDKDTSFKDITAYKEGGNHKKDDKKDPNKPEKFSHWAGFEMGFNGYLNSSMNSNFPKQYQFLDLNYGKSINVNLNLFEKTIPVIKNYMTVVTGLGIEWNNYRFQRNTTLTPNIDSLGGTLDAKQYAKSKLVTDYITVPLLIELNTNRHEAKSVHLAFGVVGAYLYRSHTKQVYDEGGKTIKSKSFDDFNLNPFKASATVRFGYGKSFNIYANYAFTDMFRNGTGPELHPFSIGLTLIPF